MERVQGHKGKLSQIKGECTWTVQRTYGGSSPRKIQELTLSKELGTIKSTKDQGLMPGLEQGVTNREGTEGQCKRSIRRVHSSRISPFGPRYPWKHRESMSRDQ